jgi:hypothetical protein
MTGRAEIEYLLAERTALIGSWHELVPRTRERTGSAYICGGYSVRSALAAVEAE